MKRKSFIDRGIRCALALGMLVLAAACDMDGVGHSPWTEEKVDDAGWAAVDNSGEGAAVSAEPPGEKAARATLIQDEPEIGIQGGLLTCGGLTAAMPDGVEARLVEAQDNGNIFWTD